MPEIFFLYYEEMDWCTQMTNAGYELWYEPRCTVFHKESEHRTVQQATYLLHDAQPFALHPPQPERCSTAALHSLSIYHSCRKKQPSVCRERSFRFICRSMERRCQKLFCHLSYPITLKNERPCTPLLTGFSLFFGTLCRLSAVLRHCLQILSSAKTFRSTYPASFSCTLPCIQGRQGDRLHYP